MFSCISFEEEIDALLHRDVLRYSFTFMSQGEICFGYRLHADKKERFMFIVDLQWTDL